MLCVFLYTRTHVHTYTRTHVHTYTRVRACKCARTRLSASIIRASFHVLLIGKPVSDFFHRIANDFELLHAPKLHLMPLSGFVGFPSLWWLHDSTRLFTCQPLFANFFKKFFWDFKNPDFIGLLAWKKFFLSAFLFLLFPLESIYYAGRCARIRIRTYVCKYVHAYAHTCASTYTHTHTYAGVCIRENK